MRADKSHPTPRTLFHVLAFTVAAITATGCVYFNALYNANKLFDQGRKEIERGSESSGRATLGLSIEKAERILEKNPDSRWADDALRLLAQARLLRQEWPEAAEASRRLMQYAESRRDTARVAGYLGTAEFHLGHAELADSLLSLSVAEEKDRSRRASLLLSRGQARAQLGRVEAADSDFQAVAELKPAWVTPRLGRMRLLVDNRRGSEAAAEYAAILSLSFRESEEPDLVESAEYLAGLDPESGILALADVESSNLSRTNRARLIKLRGDLRLGRGREQDARADYERVTEIAPTSRAAAEARLALVRLDLGATASMEELSALKEELDRALTMPAGAADRDTRRLRDWIERVEFWVGSGDLGYMAAAEAARDQLGAPRLARRLFLDYAGEDPEALWAAKAILAALDLSAADSGPTGERAPDAPDARELRRRLLEDYGESAYVQALVGGTASGFTYEELETGLRRQLERLKTMADQALSRRRNAIVQPE